MTNIVTRLRLLARCLWVQFLDWFGYLRRAEKALREQGAILTLTLHRVLDDVSYAETNSLSGIILRERTFQELVRFVTESYDPVDLAQATPGSIASRLRVVVTFDDGWRDNYTTAFPIIRAARLPVTIFVCPALLQQDQPFWPERAIRLLKTSAKKDARPDQFSDEIERLKACTTDERDRFFREIDSANNGQSFDLARNTVDQTMSWTEILEMNQSGVRFGSHTDTHQILTTISPDAARSELQLSKVALEATLGNACQEFAYPNGNWSAVTRRLVQEAGFARALSTEHGPWIAKSDPLAIPRMNVSEGNVVGLTGRFSPAMFRYTTAWKAWRSMHRNSLDLPAGLRTPKSPSPTSIRASEVAGQK